MFVCVEVDVCVCVWSQSITSLRALLLLPLRWYSAEGSLSLSVSNDALLWWDKPPLFVSPLKDKLWAQKFPLFNCFDICSSVSWAACALYWANLWRAKSLYVVWHTVRVEKVQEKRKTTVGGCYVELSKRWQAQLLCCHFMLYFISGVISVVYCLPRLFNEKQKGPNLCLCVWTVAQPLGSFCPKQKLGGDPCNNLPVWSEITVILHLSEPALNSHSCFHTQAVRNTCKSEV